MIQRTFRQSRDLCLLKMPHLIFLKSICGIHLHAFEYQPVKGIYREMVVVTATRIMTPLDRGYIKK